ncbi:hypothetical protein UF75_4076 [Desulfosporosinus sp. I2]|nr:hypothetical protein UF75_4076 [Desulfosporosinus sp. I2]
MNWGYITDRKTLSHLKFNDGPLRSGSLFKTLWEFIGEIDQRMLE